MISALGEDLLDAILLPKGLHLSDVLDCHTLFGCDLLGMSADRVPKGLNELRVVEQSNPSTVERRGHRFRMTDTRNRALDDYAIEARKHASDVSLVTLDQVRHRPTIRPSRYADLPLWFEAMPG